MKQFGQGLDLVEQDAAVRQWLGLELERLQVVFQLLDRQLARVHQVLYLCVVEMRLLVDRSLTPVFIGVQIQLSGGGIWFGLG